MAYKTSSGFDTDFLWGVPFPVLRQTVVSGMAARAFPHRISATSTLHGTMNRSRQSTTQSVLQGRVRSALQDMGTTVLS